MTTVHAVLAVAVVLAGQEPVTAVVTPDSTLNRAFQRAARIASFTTLETPSGASSTQASIASVDLLAYGQFEAVRRLLDLQRRGRRPDGRIPARLDSARAEPEEDELASTLMEGSDLVATSFWLAALYEYWLYTADTAFVRAAWPAVFDAYRWALSRDRDGDLLPEGPDGRDPTIHEVAVWLEGLRGLSDLAAAVGDTRTARRWAQNFERAWSGLERRYYMREVGRYAFGLHADGRPDTRVTGWPAVPMAFSLLETGRVESTLSTLGSHRLMTDWGVRTLDADDPRYAPDDPRRGAVSRALTGFAAWASYNYHRPHLAYTLLLAGAREVPPGAERPSPAYPAWFSGQVYRQLDRGDGTGGKSGLTVIPTAVLQGLLGARVDAPRNRLTFAPHLPADWDSVRVSRYPIGTSRVDLQIVRKPRPDRAALIARLRGRDGTGSISVRYRPGLPPGSRILEVRVDSEPREFGRRRDFDDPHPAVRLRLDRSAEITVIYDPGPAVIPIRPDPSSREPSATLRILRYGYDAGTNRYRLEVEGRARRRYTVEIISPGAAPRNPSRGRLTTARAGRYDLVFELPGEPEAWVRAPIEFSAPERG